MKVFNYFDSSDQVRWLEEMRKCKWGAGDFLCKMLTEGTFFDTVGEGSKVLLLTDGKELISFCTYARMDDIQPTELTPWMGFVFTFPEHRGHRYVGRLFEEIERLAKEEHVTAVYISTVHVGLYEKYGCEYMNRLNDIEGNPSRVYVKKIGL